MKNNKHSLFLLVLVLCTSITSVFAQPDVSILTPYSMAITTDPLVEAGRGDSKGGAYAVGAGANRLLVAFVMGEDNADTNVEAIAVTYGGQPMTKVIQLGMYAPGFDTYTSMWILKEADLLNALGDMVEVTWKGDPAVLPSGQGQVDCIVFANVDQMNPIGASGSGFTAAGLTVETTAVLKAYTGDYVISNIACANFSGTHAWDNGFVDATTAPRPTGGFGLSLGGYKAGTGVDETPKCTGSATQARRVLVAGVVRKVGSPLSISDNALAANAINVYPNPTSDILNIESASSSEKEISVFNSLGQVISKVRSNGNAQIDLKSLNVSGFVIVQVIADGKISNHKVIVK